jgi:hypothetical protein
MSIFGKKDDMGKEENNSANKENKADDKADKQQKDTGSQTHSVNLEKNIERFKQVFGNSCDLAVNLIKRNDGSICCANIYFLGLSDGNIINNLALETGRLIQADENLSLKALISRISCLRPTKESISFDTACQSCLQEIRFSYRKMPRSSATTATNSNEGRSISEPTSQTHYKRAQKMLYTENINKNVYLIRRRIRNTALRVKTSL